MLSFTIKSTIISFLFLFLSAKTVDAQGEYLKSGQSGSIFGGVFGIDINNTVYSYGAAIGYSIQARVDIAGAIVNVKPKGGTGVTVFGAGAGLHLVKNRDFGILAFTSISKFSIDGFESNSYGFGLKIYGVFESNRAPRAFPYFSVGTVSTKVRKLFARFPERYYEEFRESKILISVGLDLIEHSNNKSPTPVFGVSLSHFDKFTSINVSLSVLYSSR
ncbi:MAG: hypothetical protein IIB00_06370 [candidate division Zixibacteria bacterium]|nr:hypothetical protein [candidate division Zixibacteria bacterium]